MNKGLKFDGNYLNKPPLDSLPPKAMIDFLESDLILPRLSRVIAVLLYRFQLEGDALFLYRAVNLLMESDGPATIAIKAIGQVAGFGAKKYAPGNYLLIESQRRYVAAALRHLLLVDPDSVDEESGIPHKWHALWNVLAAIEAGKNYQSEYLYDIIEKKQEQ